MFEKIAFFGSSDFAIPILEALLKSSKVELIVTQIPRPAGRNKRLTPTPVSSFARKNNLNLVEIQNVNDENFINYLKEMKIDVGIVIAFGQILKPKLLEAIPQGFFNVHASLLPKYRGAAPIQRTLFDGANESGITIFKIDKGLDTGKIAMAERIEVDPLDTFDTLSKKLALLGAKMISDFVKLQKVELRDQEGTPSYAPKITTDETIINWNLPALKIGNLIRALDSKPGARTTLNGEMVKLFGFSGIMDVNGRPGEIIKINSKGMIGCGDHSIILSHIQFQSKKVMSFSEAKNGRKIDTGSIFGT
ncbi:methionyl-tRNA formyltransferase [Athalassotoga saccharophila]|uniref:methionyl-tRNA formyltransferase n=1 Tax=Athalassotoga saccharophila TaxID=1441386 RepID=UPI0013799D62|nr:methionyl-tRNA formyltransferase [Athalassotoga saccharophila]BBJ28485.1 methionyl-tRNA formyltransferase [Athalassotoga saccharophila]